MPIQLLRQGSTCPPCSRQLALPTTSDWLPSTPLLSLPCTSAQLLHCTESSVPGQGKGLTSSPASSSLSAAAALARAPRCTASSAGQSVQSAAGDRCRPFRVRGAARSRGHRGCLHRWRWH